MLNLFKKSLIPKFLSLGWPGYLRAQKEGSYFIVLIKVKLHSIKAIFVPI
jgi:hypothetical protein